LNADKTDAQNIEVLSKKHDEFERALQMQESRLNEIKSTAENLIKKEHSKSNHIKERQNEIFARWKELKEDLIQKFKEVGEVQTLQEFWKTADEYDEWLDEKIVIAEQPIKVKIIFMIKILKLFCSGYFQSTL
jgi:spectrin alpha